MGTGLTGANTKLMRRFFSFLSRNKKTLALMIGVFVLGSFFRWEVKEVDDARTGKRMVTYNGIVLPWQPCGPGNIDGSGTINFHVRHWVFYGLIRIEATGQTFINS